MGKPTKSLLELEQIACAALRSAGAAVTQLAIAPSAARPLGSNWTLLHVDGERMVTPVIEELIRPIQSRYDLGW